MDNIITIELKSRTVFWTDLGFKYTSDNRSILAEWWDAEVEPWILENIKDHCNPHEAGVWFADPEDAMLFKLVWAGMAPV